MLTRCAQRVSTLLKPVLYSVSIPRGPLLCIGDPAVPSQHRSYCNLSAADFDRVSEETLESLCERFEELNELSCCPEDFDITYAAGVLTAHIGADNGTYVINKQAPNAQIWLSSPVSGPKRYDFSNNRWVYRHDGSILHELLTSELKSVFSDDSQFSKCSYS